MGFSRRSSRRSFLATASGGVVGLVGRRRVPVDRARVGLRAASPSNRINIGAIGTGRISRGHDMPGVWKYDQRPHHGGLRSRLEARRGRAGGW